MAVQVDIMLTPRCSCLEKHASLCFQLVENSSSKVLSKPLVYLVYKLNIKTCTYSHTSYTLEEEDGGLTINPDELKRLMTVRLHNPLRLVDTV